MTRIAAIKTPHTSKNTPNGTQYANQHIAIMKIEKMCLLGNDLPFVLLCMSGSISSASYGRGAS